ncbi:hypothetical protein SERLA73DRAFT_75337 [Serpula lacrymans var. lacrymans S7.3]|uniref:Integrase catalytic domain-containing protein n=2 Tax=Serpula lacrymans var. lacrymans TaxID=341189 RepID=F8Q3B6_SERL3|nr:uncharacterized protein SERLADRAFT_440008 [Serpula lacrymans var. lacrymans S7.9]EGN97677.1 hypothetical protein SERLA73DRAFT_75337 [Serpula lacrymans var. lacrymans S7.3]EGO23268.1 hypothetical protein SERLADRAFT_440008 [Serpula lacrymans var. lacrymans S7.9]
MTDRGSHFDCKEVLTWCRQENIEIIRTPARSPWVNGLIEDANKILIGQLKQLCTTRYKEDEVDFDIDKTPAKWPLQLTTAIAQMNSRVLPSLGFSPRELLMGIVLTDAERPKAPQDGTATANIELTEIHMAFVDGFRAEVFLKTLEHAGKRKAIFDKKVKLVMFEERQLVQMYIGKEDTHKAPPAYCRMTDQPSGQLRTVLAFIETVDRGDISACCDLLSDEFIYDAPSESHGPLDKDAYRKFSENTISPHFSALKTTVLDVIESLGKVSIRAETLIPATGDVQKFDGHFELVGDKIVLLRVLVENTVESPFHRPG